MYLEYPLILSYYFFKKSFLGKEQTLKKCTMNLDLITFFNFSYMLIWDEKMMVLTIFGSKFESWVNPQKNLLYTHNNYTNFIQLYNKLTTSSLSFLKIKLEKVLRVYQICIHTKYKLRMRIEKEWNIKTQKKTQEAILDLRFCGFWNFDALYGRILLTTIILLYTTLTKIKFILYTSFFSYLSLKTLPSYFYYYTTPLENNLSKRKKKPWSWLVWQKKVKNKTSSLLLNV